MSSSSWVKFLKSHSPLLNPAGLRLACARDRLLRSRHFFRNQVADRLDLHIFDCEQIPQQAGTAPADADDSQPHSLSRIEWDTDHRRVRTFRFSSCEEIWIQNVGRNYESRAANGGAL